MNPSIIRGIGIGLFVSALLLTLLPIAPSTTSQSTNETPKGYELIDSNELTTLHNELNTTKEQLAQIQMDLQEASKEPEESVSIEETPTVTNTVLIIRENMTSTDISSTLEQAGVIKNRRDLDNYLIDKELSKRIQIGTYNLNSSMTLAEIADLITK